MQESQKEKNGDTWADDQKDRDYYYDDSHGYEEYDPEDEVDEESENQERPQADLPDLRI